MKKTLEELYEAKQKASDNFNALGMVNTNGKSAQQQIALDQAYEQARRDYYAAEAEYRNALHTQHDHKEGDK